MTRRLYYTDSYLTKAQSRVLDSTDDGLRVSLDETIFYPTSGGQPHDLGTLNRIPVIDVVDEGDAITHILAEPLRDTSVDEQINWPRRYDHMQQHTGQHLLSAVFEELFQIPTLSFRMGADVSTIELGTSDLTNLQIDEAVFRATGLARANPPVRVSFEDAESAQGLRKASERSGTLRIVEIAGIDRSACGGTHVATLAEVLPLQLLDSEKLRGNTRISFVCGNRAISRAGNDFAILNRLTKVLATSTDKLETQVANLQQRLALAEKENVRLASEAAARAGLDLYQSVQPARADGIRLHHLIEPSLDENTRTKAKAYAGQPKAIILIQSPDGVLLACSPDSGLNAGALLKKILTRYGAKGGGSPTMAQGSLNHPGIMNDLKQELGLEC